MEFEVRVSVDVGVLPLNIRNKFNRSLFSLIIRLANYNITTSLIYKSDIGDTQSFQYIVWIEVSVVKHWKKLDKITLPWKTEFGRGISVIEDQIPELLYYYYRNVLQKRRPL